MCFGGDKLNCFKAMQVLGGPTQILIWGSEIAQSPTSKFKGGKGGAWSFGIRWDLNFREGLGTPMMPCDQTSWSNPSQIFDYVIIFIV